MTDLKDIIQRLDNIEKKLGMRQYEKTEPEIDWEAEVRSGRCFVEVSGTRLGVEEWTGPYLLERYNPYSPWPFSAGGLLYKHKHARIATVPGVWRSWHGGECPVESGNLICVKHRNGEYQRGVAGMFNENLWKHKNGSVDIVAFCVLP